MNDSNKMMEFTSKKYSDDELREMGVVARRSLVCRKIDFNNPHFLNYHLHDLISGSNGKIKDHDAYIVEGGSHYGNPKLNDIEILYFGTRMHKDKFIFMNHENFKMIDHDGNVTHEELALTYLN